MSDEYHLVGLSFATIGRASHLPGVLISDRIERLPEGDGGTAISGFLHPPCQLSILDEARILDPELELPATIVDGPR